MPLYNIAFYSALSFLAGTAAAGFNLSVSAGILFFAAAAITLIYLKKIERPIGLFLIFAFAFGIFYYGMFFETKAGAQKITFGGNVEFSGLVSQEPKMSEKFQTLAVNLDYPMAGEISVLASLEQNIGYGDIISASGEIVPAESSGQKPASFFPKISVVDSHKGFWLKENLLAFKQSIIAQFKKFLPSDSAALLSGLTLGWRGDFTNEFKNQMALSGTTHMVALSGYNVTILVDVIAAIFGYWLSRRATFSLTSLTMILFVLMVGLEASVIRAVIMGFLVIFAKEAGRRYSMRNAIALTGAAMVITDPGTIFDIGFILSFLSLLGILLLGPAITKFLRIEDKPKSFMSWRENAITTLSAQLAVAPVLIMVFGNFSLTGIAANILILEFVPLTMLLGFILAAVGSMFYYLGFIVSFLENTLLQYELHVIKIFADLSVPILSGMNSWALFAAYYLLLIAFASRWRSKEAPALV